MEKFNKICGNILKEKKIEKIVIKPIILKTGGLEKFNTICSNILNEEDVNTQPSPEPNPTDLGDENTLVRDTEDQVDLNKSFDSQNEPIPDPSEQEKALIDKFNKEIQNCIPSLSDVKTKLTNLFNLAVEYKETNPEIFANITEDIRKNTNNITTQIGSFEQVLMLTKSNMQDKFIDNKKETEKETERVNKPKTNTGM